MAVGIIPYLDNEKGAPIGLCYCSDQCTHTDCAEVRAFHNTKCRICGKKFVGGDSYFTDKHDSIKEKATIFSIVHANCWGEEFEAQQ